MTYLSFPRLFACLLLIMGVLMMGNRVKIRPPSVVPPDQALATFHLADGFQIELVASEPLVADPVAMEIDEAGRLYVVEMHGYPMDKSGTGKIKLLSDSNGDGQMDKSEIFAEGLILPTGIMRWKNGVVVTDAPNVLYFEDADGDGRAEKRDTLLTGFALSNPQHNLNNPILGLDNWIYLGHESAITTLTYKAEFGDRGGDVRYPNRQNSPQLPDNARGRSVRFRPDQTGLEMLAGKTQYGHSFDRWGRYLVVSNANHVMHEVIPASYTNRNLSLLVADAVQSISDHGNAAEVFPITQNPLNQLLTDVGVFTSACAITAYQGGLFPAPFDNVTFVAEPVSNLIHADVLNSKGASFTASRLYANNEFLASTDAWFRPVNMYTGPDGALYVVDYYRQIIEHPEWMADDVIKSGALYNGTDKGRIYRISPKGTKKADWAGNLNVSRFSNAQLVQKLADPNIWWRRNAQRLLIDRQTGEKELDKLVTSGSPLGRLHALWTLEGLKKLRPELLLTALEDKAAGVRENAIKLAEPFLDNPAVAKQLLAMQNDADARVRFQLLCTLGFLESQEAAQVRENLLFKDVNDPWVQIGALSAVPSAQGDLLDRVISRYNKDQPALGDLLVRISTMTGYGGSPEAIKSALKKSRQPLGETNVGWQSNVMQGLAKGLKNNSAAATSLQDEREPLINAALQSESPAIRQSSVELLRFVGLPKSKATQVAMDQSTRTVLDKRSAVGNRIAALSFLGLDQPGKHADLLQKIITPAEPTAVQLAALRTLSDIPGLAVSEFVIKNWSSLTADVRTAAINTFLTDDQRVSRLLDAIEQKIIDPGSLGWPRTVGLMARNNAALKQRARSLLTKKDDSRQDIIRAYEPALTLAANVARGQTVFRKNCSTCHQVEGKSGIAYGPDLGTIRNRRPESILGDILNPNFSIADGYDLWTFEMKSGETLQGLIATETPTALTIRYPGGQETVVARQDIKSLKSLGMSVMPTGLENTISKQEMADLLVFLKQVR